MRGQQLAAPRSEEASHNRRTQDPRQAPHRSCAHIQHLRQGHRADARRGQRGPAGRQVAIR